MNIKKLVPALALMAVVLFAPPARAEVYTYDTTEPVTKGVELRRIRRFYGDSWLNILCVKADLKEEHVGLSLLKGSGADTLATVGDLIKTEPEAVAAANADFFDPTYPSTSQGFSLGIEVKDGKLLQSQIDENMAAAFYDGSRLLFSYMSMDITVTAPNGEACPVRHLNKHTDYYGDVLMYTSDWNNGLSPAPGGEVVEVVVDGGVVTELRRNLPPVKIPENGCVFDVSEGVNMFFANNFGVGDKIDISITATPSLDGVDTAFGGGTLLLSGGEKTPYTHTIAGSNPRTCIGTNADGTVVYIIVVDGRQRISRGVTMSELTDIALELGCVNALNLDGGGSTRMLASTFWNSSPHVVNSPSENRKVINAVSVVSDAPTGEAVGVRIRSAANAVLLGDSLAVESRLYDENENPVFAAEEAPVWTVTGVDGVVEPTDGGGVFLPYTAGTATLTASYKGVASEPLTVEVIGALGGISLPESLELDAGETYALVPEVYSSDGAYAFVGNPRLLSPSSSDPSVADINEGVITARSEGYAVITLSYDGFYAHTLVKVGSPAAAPPAVDENIYMDDKHGVVYGGDSFGVFACGSAPVTLLDTLVYRRGLAAISSSTSYGFLGEYDASQLPAQMRTPIAANSFSAIDRGFALIISLPRSGRLSGGDWISMANALASSSAPNVIVLTNTAPNGQTEADTQVFYDYMDFISKAKNVFVVQSGQRNNSHLRGNVCFITLSDSSLPSAADAADRVSVLRFTAAGTECKFMFEPVFPHE